MGISYQERQRLQTLDREQLGQYQLRQLNALLEEVLPANEFYGRKLAGVELPLASLAQLSELPFTSKNELLDPPDDEADDQWAANRTYPLQQYVRFHRTSGTRGRPMVVLDTAEDWQWWIDGWQFVFDAAEVDQRDRIMMAFSFGPFIGFWTANDAAVARGALVIPGGGMSSVARLQLLGSSQATCLCCTPTYALHLAEVADQQKMDIRALPVRKIVVAGEPGGSVPEIRGRIESRWAATVIDHGGATEVGPWGFADVARRGMHVNESQFIVEFCEPETGQPAAAGEPAEMVLTTLGRTGCPVIRYQTGDLVQPVWDLEGPSRFVLLEGGVLGRVDEMMIIRGVNIFPTSVERILRGFDEVAEYRLIADKAGAMDRLTVEIEAEGIDPSRVAQRLELQLGLKIQLRTVPAGTLPRFEGKGRRFVDNRQADNGGASRQ